jgi:hypothetical protein
MQIRPSLRPASAYARVARFVLWLLVLPVVAVSAPSAAQIATGPLQPESPPPGPFQKVCQELRDSRNPYFGLGFLAEVQGRYEQATDANERTAFQGLLGRELLKHGRLDEAIDNLELAFASAQAQARTDDLATAVHWHLALAHLAKAEDENCVGHRTGASCIVPIRADAVHPLPEHSRKAAALFLDYARKHPKNLQAIWLLNLASRVSGDFPEGVPTNLRIDDSRLGGGADGLGSDAMARWQDIAVDLGINATDLAGGAVVEDFDGDGFLDLVTSTWDPCGAMTAFRNDGSGGFDNVTAAWGLDEQLGGLNLIHADYDNDGRLDLLVLRGAWLLGDGRIRNSLLRNVAGPQGAPRFVDVTEASAMAQPAYPTQTAAWADFDLDGDLDLYVGNEATEASPYPSQLYRNLGDGSFEEIAAQAGVENLRYSKGVAWGDYDADGDPDLFVSNFGENRLYRNDGPLESPEGWKFVDVAAEYGVTRPERESFASWFFDYDNDGDLDLFVGDYEMKVAQVTGSYMGMSFEKGQPLLYQNQLADSPERVVGFKEVSRQVGLVRPAMPMGANYGDIDNDGWLDIYLGTGEPDLASLMPNQMYRNRAGHFEEVTFPGGFGHLQKGHGVAFGDVDNDGDQDLFHQLGGFYPGDTFGNALFENPGNDNHWLSLELVGKAANRFAVGARLKLVVARKSGEQREIYLLVGAGGSFGESSLRQEVGLGDATRLVGLEVQWPRAGTLKERTQVFDAAALALVKLDRHYQLTEGEAILEPVERTRISLRSEGTHDHSEH